MFLKDARWKHNKAQSVSTYLYLVWLSAGPDQIETHFLLAGTGHVELVMVSKKIWFMGKPSSGVAFGACFSSTIHGGPTFMGLFHVILISRQLCRHELWQKFLKNKNYHLQTAHNWCHIFGIFHSKIIRLKGVLRSKYRWRENTFELTNSIKERRLQISFDVIKRCNEFHLGEVILKLFGVPAQNYLYGKLCTYFME